MDIKYSTKKGLIAAVLYVVFATHQFHMSYSLFSTSMDRLHDTSYASLNMLHTLIIYDKDVNARLLPYMKCLTESIKPTSMETVHKEHYQRSKDKAEKMI